jgi:hypothetical protein
MQRLLIRICCGVIGLMLLNSTGSCYVDTCNKYHKRAPVDSVCGQVTNPLGEAPDGVELTLSQASGSAVFTAKADSKGKFFFGDVPKGDYTLRVLARGYTAEERELRVIRNLRSCKKPQIEVRLSVRSCDGGIYIKGVDKATDLFHPDSSR